MDILIDLVNFFIDAVILYLLGLVATVIILILWGAIQPSTQPLKVVKRVKAPVRQVWSLMTDWHGQIEWRKDIRSIEFIDETNFVEHHTLRGPALNVEVVSLEPGRSIELKLSGLFNVEYCAEFSEQDDYTVISISGVITKKSIYRRIVTKLFDFDDAVNIYFNLLNEHMKLTAFEQRPSIHENDNISEKPMWIVTWGFIGIFALPLIVNAVAKMIEKPFFPDWVHLIMR